MGLFEFIFGIIGAVFELVFGLIGGLIGLVFGLFGALLKLGCAAAFLLLVAPLILFLILLL